MLSGEGSAARLAVRSASSGSLHLYHPKLCATLGPGQSCACVQCNDWCLMPAVYDRCCVVTTLRSHVYTNPATLTAQGLAVMPYHSHDCPVCPVNMCKGRILQQHRQMLLGGSSSHSVVYVGDGSNDLCPAQRLGPGDVVMVRAGYALDKLLQDPAVKSTVTAKVHRWSHAAEIERVLLQQQQCS